MTASPLSAARVTIAAAVVAGPAGLYALATGSRAAAGIAGVGAVVSSIQSVRAARRDRPAGEEATAARSEDPTSETVARADTDAVADEHSSDGDVADATVTPASPSAGDETSPERLVAEPARDRRDDVPGDGAVMELEGLMTEQFLEATLHGRVAVARRALRPLSVVYFEVFESHDEDNKVPVSVKEVAAVLTMTLRDSDVAGRLDDTSYVFVLEDTGEDGAVWTAERLRRNLTETDAGRRRFRAGVASYPSHGLEAAELQLKAGAALSMARDWSRDRIEVATST